MIDSTASRILALWAARLSHRVPRISIRSLQAHSDIRPVHRVAMVAVTVGCSSTTAGLSARVNPLFWQGMKSLVLGLLALSSTLALGQNKELTTDESVPIPRVAFDAKGELQITASSNSSPDDFDFLVGKWKMHNRHLNKRLADCRDWTEFDSSDANTKILNGAADMDTYSTTEFPGLEGKLFERLTLRQCLRRRKSQTVVL